MLLIDKIRKVFFPFYKSKKVKKIISILNTKNRKQAMFVGGCVRKYLSNEKIDDIDIATVFTPHQIIEKFINSDVEVKKTGLLHGTLTLVSEGKSFEVTTLREDVSTDGRHAQVSFTDNWEKDSERRDFTINAIYLDERGKIFDPQLGLKDLKNKKVRFIGDPDKRIKEDYLRILRYIRFSIQYKDLKADETTSKAIQLNLNGVKKLSKERIYSELTKIIKLENFQDIFKNKFLLDVFKLIFPEFINIERAKNFTQIRNLKRIILEKDVILASMLINSSNNHEYFSHKYKVSNETKDNLNFYAKLLKEIKINKNFFAKDLKKNIFYNGRDKIKSVFLIFNLMKEKTIPSKITDMFSKIDSISIPRFPITGNDLLSRGVKGGRKVGELMKKMEKKWIENNFNLNDEEIKSLLKKNI